MNNKKQEARAEGLRKGIKRNKRISKPGGVKGKEEKDKKKEKITRTEQRDQKILKENIKENEKKYI